MEKPTTLVFGNNYGLEFTVTVMENRYDRFTVFSLDFLGIAAVRGITAVMNGNRILLITQMHIHLTFKPFLPSLRVQLFQNLADISFSLELLKELLT